MEGAIGGESFRPCIDRVLVPTLCPGDIVKEHKRNKRNKRNNRNDQPRGAIPELVLAWALRESVH
jgi:hypothetical protein